MTRGSIAFIDDEPRLCAAAADWLEASGFEVETFTDAALALGRIEPARCDCVVTDLRMPGLDGQEVLARLRAADPDLPVILLSGHGDVPVAVEAMRMGAHDFLEKPYGAEHLVEVLDRAVDLRRVRREARTSRRSDLASARIEGRLVGASPAIAALRRMVQDLSDVAVDLLIRGETGSGKEELARTFHDFSRRARRPFVAIHCAGLPEAQFEAELFGHERGYLAGTAAARIGKLEHASGGTVFFNEIEAMPLSLQSRLLRALQERGVERLGSNALRPVDLRIMAATRVDLLAEVAAGRFRADLYYRLSPVALDLPPLRERTEDIPLLFLRFAEEAAARFGRPVPTLREADLRALRGESWPGNVGELKAAAERAVLGMRPPAIAAEPEALPLPERMARIEAGLIAEALEECGGSSALAADRLGLPRRTLNEKIARYGLRAS
ncbi:sigma-54 dependent transcriptional regulator [Cereibacter johrii]|uniref:sigma-54-dependent transcriptional regulator n=1 Tax=Cereibacter johrii TaxID=445629 RepID=UPI002B264325|nr:sigma-54 dependent transcriptional regulator [Cereibacter johrii]MEA5163265.1 sigma-54 dependent transcriptional regulator [Cereibacter johrii]